MTAANTSAQTIETAMPIVARPVSRTKRERNRAVKTSSTSCVSIPNFSTTEKKNSAVKEKEHALAK